MLEDLLVARLAPERMHGLNATEALDEVHDDERDRLTRRAVRTLGAAAEPAGDHEQHREGAERQQGEPKIEQQQRDADAHHEQQRSDEVDEPVAEQVGDRLDVGCLARNDAARGVTLVKRDAQPLKVDEEPAADVEHDLLADAPEQQQERVERHRRHDGRDHHRDHDGDERSDAAAAAVKQRRDALVDPLLDEPRHREPAGRAHGDQHRRDQHRAVVRTYEIAQQRAAA